MREELTKLIESLNLVEVRGKTNLALLYNAIDRLEYLRANTAPEPIQITEVQEDEHDTPK